MKYLLIFCVAIESVEMNAVERTGRVEVVRGRGGPLVSLAATIERAHFAVPRVLALGVRRTASHWVVARDARPHVGVSERSVRQCARVEETREREVRRINVILRHREQFLLEERECALLVLERSLQIYGSMSFMQLSRSDSLNLTATKKDTQN